MVTGKNYLRETLAAQRLAQKHTRLVLAIVGQGSPSL